MTSPAAVRTQEGDYLLLCRVDGYKSSPHFCAARSANGISDWQIDADPTMVPQPGDHPEEAWGIEDPRITYLPELDKYAVTYTSLSPEGPCASIALTKDFRTFERLGTVLHPDNKHAALFPRRVNGSWAMINRPRSRREADMWISYSPDLINWGDHKLLMRVREDSWDQYKISIGPPPIETPEGWLVLYLGAQKTSHGSAYHMGLALLDPKDPSKVVRRSKSWVFGHERDYEQMGDAHGIAFSCGAVLEPDGESLLLYYRCATTEIAVARSSLSELRRWLLADAGNACCKCGGCSA